MLIEERVAGPGIEPGNRILPAIEDVAEAGPRISNVSVFVIVKMIPYFYIRTTLHWYFKMTMIILLKNRIKAQNI